MYTLSSRNFLWPFLLGEAQDKGVTVDLTTWDEELAMCQVTVIRRGNSSSSPKHFAPHKELFAVVAGKQNVTSLRMFL
jgi:hypothetical protein